MIARAFLVTVFNMSLLFGAATYSSAQVSLTADTVSTSATGPFIRKRYSIKGEWSVHVNDQGQTEIRFSEDFKTKGGPDLKVFLTAQSVNDLDSSTAADGSVSIGVLKSKSGQQSYTVPDEINLTDFKSVIIHCAAFSVLWGGFDLPSEKMSQEP